jgi:hypothetical protein
MGETGVGGSVRVASESVFGPDSSLHGQVMGSPTDVKLGRRFGSESHPATTVAHCWSFMFRTLISPVLAGRPPLPTCRAMARIPETPAKGFKPLYI